MVDRKELVRALSESVQRWDSQDQKIIVDAQGAWAQFCVQYGASGRCGDLVWHEPVTDFIASPVVLKSYAICAIDGSYLLYGHHEGVHAALINHGIVVFHYAEKSSVVFQSKTAVLGPDVLLDTPKPPRETVESWMLAQELLLIGSQTSEEIDKVLYLLDGSLSWWQQHFAHGLPHGVLLQQLFADVQKNNTMYASYTSAPRSRDIIKFLNMGDEVGSAMQGCESLCDADIFLPLLSPGERTVCFCKQLPEYDTAVCPAFFYLRLPNECVRVEIPSWIARDAQRLSWVHAIMVDQCDKGNGYPIASAYAHEQANIAPADKQFFNNLLALQGHPLRRSGKGVSKQ